MSENTTAIRAALEAPTNTPADHAMLVLEMYFADKENNPYPSGALSVLRGHHRDQRAAIEALLAELDADKADARRWRTLAHMETHKPADYTLASYIANPENLDRLAGILAPVLQESPAVKGVV